MGDPKLRPEPSVEPDADCVLIGSLQATDQIV